MPDPKIALRATKTRPRANPDAWDKAFAAHGCRTLEERAAHLGITARHLRRLVHEGIEPLLGNAREIARRLDTTVDTLWPAA